MMMSKTIRRHFDHTLRRTLPPLKIQCLDNGLMVASCPVVATALAYRTGGRDDYAGQLTVHRAHEDVPALAVLAVVLGGGGLSGRLTHRLREPGVGIVGAGLDSGDSHDRKALR
jgi:predicted Zn-dependent peptidase